MPGPVRRVEIFDPQAGTFTPQGDLAVDRAFPRAVLTLQGRILLAGGVETIAPNFNAQAPLIELYDAGAGRSTVIGALKEPRYAHSLSLLPNGRVMATGGWKRANPVVALQSAESIQPVSGEVIHAPPSPTARSEGAAVTLADGRVLLLGGFVYRRSASDFSLNQSAEIYTP
jgi:hypothetical protein